MLYNDIDNDLSAELGPDEKLLWTGRPKTGILFRGSDIFLIPFSLLWGGFAIFWELTAINMQAPFFFKLFGIPFVLIGIYITVGRFFIDAKRRANTVYGITDDRILIRSGIFSKETKSLNLRTLSDVSISQKSDGRGSITFGPTDMRYNMMQGMAWPGIKQPPSFEHIEDVKSVYDKIIELQRQK